MKYQISYIHWTTARDGGTKLFKVFNVEETGISEVYQDFRINSETKGKFFTAYPNSHNAEIIPDENIEKMVW